MKKIDTAVILCAGNGSRMRPFTNFYPKSLLPIKDKIALEIVVWEALKSGAKHIIFVHNKEDVFIKSFSKWFNEEYKTDAKFSFCVQQEKTGAGGAVMACEHLVKKPFFLAFSDDLTKSSVPVLSQLEEIYRKSQKNVVAVRFVKKSLAQNYGILKPTVFFENYFEFCGIVEKPKVPFKQNFANFGRYVLTPEIFKILKTLPKEDNGEIYLTKAFDVLAKENKIVAHKFEGQAFDIGTMRNYIKTFEDY